MVISLKEIDKDIKYLYKSRKSGFGATLQEINDFKKRFPEGRPGGSTTEIIDYLGSLSLLKN